MALAIDASTPALASSNTALTITTAAFTTPANVLLVAFCGQNGVNTGDNDTSTVSGAGLTWTLAGRKSAVGTGQISGGTGQPSCAEIWVAYSSSALTSQTVSSVRGTNSGGAHHAMQVMVITGAETTWAGAITATGSSSGTPSLALTTTQANSWVMSCVSDWAAKGNATAGTGQTIISQFHVSSQISIHFWRQTSTTATSGTSVTNNVTAPTLEQYNMLNIEIREAAGSGGTTYSVSGTAAATSAATGAMAAILLAAGTAAGISGASGDVTRIPQTVSVSGTAAAVSGASGDVTRLTVTQPVSGTATAASAAQGSVTSILKTTGTAAAISAASGDVTRIPLTLAVSGTAAAVSGASGSVSVVGGAQTYPVTGTAAASSTASGAVSALFGVTGAAAATSGANGSLSARLGVTGTAAGVSSASGDVTLVPSGPVVWQVTGTAAATAGGNGVVTLIAQAAGTAAAVSSSSGSVVNPATPLRDITATFVLTKDPATLTLADERGLFTLATDERGVFTLMPDERGVFTLTAERATFHMED